MLSSVSLNVDQRPPSVFAIPATRLASTPISAMAIRTASSAGTPSSLSALSRSRGRLNRSTIDVKSPDSASRKLNAAPVRPSDGFSAASTSACLITSINPTPAALDAGKSAAVASAISLKANGVWLASVRTWARMSSAAAADPANATILVRVSSSSLARPKPNAFASPTAPSPIALAPCAAKPMPDNADPMPFMAAIGADNAPDNPPSPLCRRSNGPLNSSSAVILTFSSAVVAMSAFQFACRVQKFHCPEHVACICLTGCLQRVSRECGRDYCPVIHRNSLAVACVRHIDQPLPELGQAFFGTARHPAMPSQTTANCPGVNRLNPARSVPPVSVPPTTHEDTASSMLVAVPPCKSSIIPIVNACGSMSTVKPLRSPFSVTVKMSRLRPAIVAPCGNVRRTSPFP